MSTPSRACGPCSLCCKVMRVDELQKPMGVWCRHVAKGSGCSIHGSHPHACGGFQCLWILSPTMPDAVRPDRSKVVMTIDDGGRRIIARADPGDPVAWRREPVHGQLRRWAADHWFKGRTIWAQAGQRMWLITPSRDIDIGETDERCPTAYQEAPDGTITVIVLPPQEQGAAFDPAAMQVAIDAGQGRRVVSPRP
jgi:hypothetical protein